MSPLFHTFTLKQSPLTTDYKDRKVGRLYSVKNILGKEYVMPVYQFVCKKHGEFEKITIRAEWDDIKCPKCGKKSKVDKKCNLRQISFLKNI